MLTEAMSYARLHHFAEMGLVLFFLVFIAVTVYAMLRPRAEMDHMRHLPLGLPDVSDADTTAVAASPTTDLSVRDTAGATHHE